MTAPADIAPDVSLQDLVAKVLTIATDCGYPKVVAGRDYPDSGDDFYKPIHAYQRDAIEEVLPEAVTVIIRDLLAAVKNLAIRSMTPSQIREMCEQIEAGLEVKH